MCRDKNCRHKWAETSDFCQKGCGMQWSEFVAEVRGCCHDFNNPFHICQLCHCSETFLDWMEEMMALMKSRADLLAELDASRENEVFTVPPLGDFL